MCGFRGICRFITEEAAQDTVEYSLMLVLLGAAALFVLSLMNASIQQVFSSLAERIERSAGAAS